MEMPISVVMVLFVSIAVGVAMVGFSGVTIDRAGQEISDLGKGVKRAEDSMVEVNSLSVSQAMSLGEQCYRDKRGELERQLCFVVRAESISVAQINDFNGDQISGVDGWSFKSEDISGDANAVFIYYNPFNAEIEFES